MCRKLIYLISFVLVLGLVLASTSQGADPTPVGNWRLDKGYGGIATDSAGNNDGTLMGGTTWVTGKIGKALSFDGDGDYVDIGNNPVFDPAGSFSVTFWAYINNWGVAWGRCMFAKGGDQDRGGWAVRRYNDVDANQPLCFTTAGVAGEGTEAGADDNTNMPGKATPPIGEWFHIACVCDLNHQVSDSNQTYIYINGVVDANRNTVAGATVAAATGGAHVYLGTRGNGDGTGTDGWTDAFFNGMLDDVRYYNVALSAAEVQETMNGTAEPPPTKAIDPNPDNKATGVENLAPTLRWRPGTYAATHDVYFGDDLDKVTDANRTVHPGLLCYSENQALDANNYPIPTPPALLKWDQTYYWRIDEVNGPPDYTIFRGDVWRFTSRNFDIMDNFEDYNNTSPNKIWEKWKANSTGKAGYSNPDYAELTIVHGGKQSLPFDYNNVNSPYYSDVNRTFDPPQNWTTVTSGLYTYHPTSLTLWFRGYPERVGSFSSTGTDPGGPYAATIIDYGADIGDVADLRHPSLFHDECHFGYKAATSGTSITNPGSTGTYTGVKIVARVDSVGYAADTVGKAGVMIRDTLDANAFNGFMCVRRITGGGYGVAFQYRKTAKGSSTTQTDVNDTGITLPCWVAVTLNTAVGSRSFRAFYSHNSTNGTNGTWYQLGTVQQFPAGTMCFGGTPAHGPLYIGLAATPQSETAKRMANFSNVLTYAGTYGSAGAWKPKDIGIKSNVAAPLYVTLQDANSPTPVSKTVNHPDNPYMVRQNTWQAWDIPFSDFTNVNLTKVKKITIGVGSATPSSAGTLYFDDIRLYLPKCIANRKAPDFTGSGCLIDSQDLRILIDNWLVRDYQVTAPVGFLPDTDLNLEGWYNLEGNLNDSSGHSGRNGDPCGNTLTYVTDSKVGTKSLSLNGILDTFAVPRTVQDDYTLMAWIKTSTFGAQTGDRTRAYQGSGLLWSDVTGDVNDFILAVLGTKLVAANGPSTQDVISTGNVMTGQWVHVAVTRVRSSGQVKLYINGMLDRTAISSSTGTQTGNPKINIGGNPLDVLYYTGLIDDIRIYSRALSHGEIAQIAGKAMPFNQPLDGLLTQSVPAINMYPDGVIDLKDYAFLAEVWLETLLWP
jgi:hypothetical protein